MSHVHAHNRRAWDARVEREDAYTATATDQQFQNPLAVIDQCGWLGDVSGKRVLCLAAGGGKQSVLYAAAGAIVTTVDLSPKMLELDRQVAAARKLKVETVEASMDDLSMFRESSFELVVQPVSTCYVPDIERVYRQVARVLVVGGLYISQHKQPVNLQADVVPSARGYLLNEPYHRTGPLPPVAAGTANREAGTLEFLHRWEQLLGGLCRNGFVIEDVAEPKHADPKAAAGTFGHRSCFVPPYIKIKARRKGEATSQAAMRKIWMP
ncbi:MAG: class I SAM-dependent methyltransferase [Verrucomicrobia bacterium]|nr:class I SAM-dependent methyltransferase [Verrucomicrobiota bacterium]